LSEPLAKRIDSNKVLRPGDQEVELRAVSIAVCDEIVARAREKFASKFDSKALEETFNAMQFDYYLWTIGKEERYRKLPRHYTQDTVFY
jgi:hypothetical protein